MNVVHYGLQEALTKVIRGQSFSSSVASAAVTDVFRALHRDFVRTGWDQPSVLNAVASIFGRRAMMHLACIIGAEITPADNAPAGRSCHFAYHFVTLCAERGIEPEQGRRFFRSLLGAFVERTPNFNDYAISPCGAVYWSVSPEAAYHLCGLYEGDLGDMVATELIGYLDTSLRRFHKLVELWQLELDFERESEQ